MQIIRLLFISLLFSTSAFSQQDTLVNGRQFGVNLHRGLSAPDQVVPATGKVPLGVELTYSWLLRNRRAWEQCNCFANVGAYANYFAFRNPVTLGRTAGAGLFFEPLIFPHRQTFYSVRFAAGLTYLTNVYDPVSNPTNRYFSLPLSAQIGVAATAHHRLTKQVHLTLSGYYNHISNAGSRQPNQGLNVPTLAIGLAYLPSPISYPNARHWRSSEPNRRWMARALLLGSIRVLPKTDKYPEMALPMYSLNLVGGYHLSRSHVLSGGIELADDHYFREQLRRWPYSDQRYRQGSLLAGYEFWHGRYVFTAHMAWNVIRPRPYRPATYQKYGLLYRFGNGLTLGFNVKAYGEDTKGFQVAGGWSF